MKAFTMAIFAAFALPFVVAPPAQADWRAQVLGTWSSTPQYRAPVTRQARRRTARTERRRLTRTERRRLTRAERRRRVRRSYRGRTLRGLASYYWQRQRVASGGWFNPNALTAAHKSLPFGTRVRVTNLRNGRSVVVRINDRGPYIRG
ncbi:MAG: septal ring lytic transglycosylase RlpA family protein, partial [Hyphomicrobiaceae bacterium]